MKTFEIAKLQNLFLKLSNFTIRKMIRISFRNLFFRQQVLQNSVRTLKELKETIAKKIPKEIERITAFRKKHDKSKLQETNPGMVFGGMRGMIALLCDTSVLDPDEGIRFRGYTIPECREKLPKAEQGKEPLPEGVFWLLLTGEIPSGCQASKLTKDWAERSKLPCYIFEFLHNLPREVHPMSQLSAALTILNTESKFVAAYNKGVPKKSYWEYCYEDALDLTAKLPQIAALIYLNTFKTKPAKDLGELNPKYDWSKNFACMLNNNQKDFVELLRLYLTIHCDHDNGNVSAHTSTVVSSALSDPYISFAAGVNGLAGPLHGLASQEVVNFITAIEKEIGKKPSEKDIQSFCEKTLKTSVIPGYGHAVLRKTDPRYTAFAEFARERLKTDPRVEIVTKLYKVVPPILKSLGKVKNPWPNVDAHSGVLMMAYGMKEMTYQTVLFAVSRSLGIMSQHVWNRALGAPIERPKSVPTDFLIKKFEGKK